MYQVSSVPYEFIRYKAVDTQRAGKEEGTKMGIERRREHRRVGANLDSSCILLQITQL